MRKRYRFVSCVVGCLVILLPGMFMGPHATASFAAEPFAVLYDAPVRSSTPLSKDELSSKKGWVELTPDDTKHHFSGNAVLMNDKLVVVAHPDATDVEVYSRGPQHLRLCARLLPIGDNNGKLTETSIAIQENNPSLVAVQVNLRSPRGQPCHVVYELNVGGAFVKTSASAGVEKLRVCAPCRFAIIPDFFGDDIVVDAARLSVSQAELPTENFLMHMMYDGDVIVMTVSESRDNDIQITMSDTIPRKITSSDITYGAKRHIAIAVLADTGIWHEKTVRLADAGQVIPLDWKMPFPALWRVDWSTIDKMTDSWEMMLQHPKGKYVMLAWFGEDAGLGQRFGPEFGSRDWNKPGRLRWNPVLSRFQFPCWVDADHQGYLQPLKNRRYVSRGQTYNFDGPAILYPLDRAKTPPFHTPIDKLTVVDLVRMTLGVGPCQYILDLEGQKKNAKGCATCYARDVINAIYEQGTQRQNQAVIDEHLNAAVVFIRNVRERIDQYVAFARQMAAYLEEQKKRDPQHGKFFDELLTITRRLDQFFEAKKEAIRTPEYAEQAADEFRSRLMNDRGKDAFEKCRKQTAVFTAIGGAQDGLVAACRMIVKTLRQRAGLAMAEDPKLKDVCIEIRTRTQAMLRNPTPYEAPRH